MYSETGSFAFSVTSVLNLGALQIIKNVETGYFSGFVK